MSPTPLTPAEVSAIKKMVTSDTYRHMPLHTLARHRPPRRKARMSEDDQQAIFDAAGLALGYFNQGRGGRAI
jgi:hypothetical protein